MIMQIFLFLKFTGKSIVYVRWIFEASTLNLCMLHISSRFKVNTDTSADECATLQLCTLFDTVKLRHPGEVTISKTHF